MTCFRLAYFILFAAAVMVVGVVYAIPGSGYVTVPSWYAICAFVSAVLAVLGIIFGVLAGETDPWMRIAAYVGMCQLGVLLLHVALVVPASIGSLPMDFISAAMLLLATLAGWKLAIRSLAKKLSHGD